MIAKSILALSLILNFYLCFFAENLDETPASQKTSLIQDKAHIKQSAPLPQSEKKTTSSLNLASKTQETINKKESIPLPKRTEEEFIPTGATHLEAQLIEKLRYDFNWDDPTINAYQELKLKYQELASKAFNVPEGHSPEDPYLPTYKESFEYYKAISQYHEKLQRLLGTKRYEQYERMRQTNNQKYNKNRPQGGELPTDNLFFMQF